MAATQSCLISITDKLDPPGRAIDAPFRFPITNLFKGQNAASSGFAVSGRLYSGVIQVGERVRVVPGDETAVIKSEWAIQTPWDFMTLTETSSDRCRWKQSSMGRGRL
jgi:translation elongation factor EF-1alpha